MQKVRQRVAVAIVLALMVGCASAPVNLSPKGTQAFYSIRVIKALDALRDFAIDANAQQPPLLSLTTTRSIVLYHEAALRLIDANQDGWAALVSTGLDQLKSVLPSDEYQRIAPYVALVRAVIEVTK